MREETRELICIRCPQSCTLKVTLLPGGEIRVEGAGCNRGIEYAREEVTNPVRPVMTVIKVKNGELPTVSVITSKPVPKKCIAEIMRATANIEVEAPVEVGQVIVKNVCGVDLIATRSVRKA